MKATSFLFALLVICRMAGAQSIPNHCATTTYLVASEAEDPTIKSHIAAIESWTSTYISNRQTASGRFPFATVPVVFHIVYNTPAQNISDQTINEQIDILNADYNLWNSDSVNIPAVWKSIEGVTHIHFCLASRDTLGNPTTGIVRTSTATTSFANSPYDHKINYTTQGGDNAWNKDHYLNIWVCNLGTGILGYTQMPGAGPASRDGCVINFMAVGKTGATAPYNLGRTVTHEVGHWLNLIHPWGDDHGYCWGTDQVADTPNEADANYSNYAPYSVKTDSCTPSAPGFMWQNYMDYTEDLGMCMFTQGQVQRMQACLHGPRDSILSSPALGPAGTSNLSLNNRMNLYPSPASGTLYIQWMIPEENVWIRIYSLSGQPVSEPVNEHSTSRISLNLENLPDGMYLMEVSTPAQKTVRKIIIRH
ncbi:MAG: M43 family zinc metalloprotease [Bacteroidia bacterium]